MYRLKVTDEAKDELRREIAYSVRHWGREHALKYRQALEKQLAALRKNPLLHPLRHDIAPGTRIKTYRGHRIVYTLDDSKKTVIVLAVLAVHQNPDANAVKARRKKS